MSEILRTKTRFDLDHVQNATEVSPPGDLDYEVDYLELAPHEWFLPSRSTPSAPFGVA
jgi:hypothetical protein